MKLRKRERLACQQLIHLLAVVTVDVQIAEGVDEVTDLETADMSDEMRQERIAGDIERNAEERIGRPLVKLAVQCAAIFHFELEQRVARGQGDFVAGFGVPAGDN